MIPIVVGGGPHDTGLTFGPASTNFGGYSPLHNR